MRDNNSYNYKDKFSDIVHTARYINAKELSKLFFSAPKWITILMKFRNVIMKPFGLKKGRDLRIWYILSPRIWQEYAKMTSILIWKLLL